MGIAPTSRCASTSAAAFNRCQRECTTHCSTDILTASTGRGKFCSWAEEEVSLAGIFGHANSSEADNVWIHGGGPPTSRALARPLVDRGGFVVVHTKARGEDAVANGLDHTYSFEASAFGRGSYGEVHIATHNRTGMVRAVKSVGKMGLRRYVKDVSAFVRREVDILRRLDHPNIVRIYEAFEDQSAMYLVLELCEGGDLLERVAVARERLPEREAAVLVAQMLGAVQHLYLRGVVHRDVKPENFLFSRREPEREPLPPERSPLKLIDFGLSRRLSFEAGTSMTQKIGTTEYMAPEAYSGHVSTALADRMDMWSVGVVLHVIFIGHFPSPRLADMSSEEYLSLPCWGRVSVQGRQILAQLLRKEPTQRPTVTVALKHPWLATAFTYGREEVVRSFPVAIWSFANSPGLRRLALLAVAREAEDADVGNVRRLFQLLQLECDGALTRPALERAAWLPGFPGAAAAELARSFDAVNCNGSGTIEWTELLAAAIGLALSGDLESASSEMGGGGHGLHGGAGLAGSGMSALPTPKEAALWSAFDLLASGGEVISGTSMAQLLAPTRQSHQSRMARHKFGLWPTGCSSDMQSISESSPAVPLGPPVGTHLGHHPAGGISPHGGMGAGFGELCEGVEDYNELVREVHAGGVLDPQGFMTLMQGRGNLVEDTGGTSGGNPGGRGDYAAA